jgi:DNA-binding response OmpR family regulator
MRVLLVEDSSRLQQYVSEGLRQAGFAVDVSSDGEEGQWAAETNEYDVIVLDIVLPKLDGITLLERLRSNGNTTHVLLLTARDTVPDRVAGLSKGADDYLVKPFALEELIARIRALTRRAYGVKSSIITVADLSINTSSRTVTRDGAAIVLQPREYALLEFLALQRGKVVARSEIEKHIYDDRAEPMSNVVDSAICQLRRKIDREDAPSLITTRRGMGYILDETG